MNRINILPPIEIVRLATDTLPEDLNVIDVDDTCLSGDMAGFQIVFSKLPLEVGKPGSPVGMYVAAEENRVYFMAQSTYGADVFKMGFDAGVCAARAQLGRATDQGPAAEGGDK